MIERKITTVYRSTLACRNFLTRRAAIHAEARALISKKYPKERSSIEDGDPGWHWTSLPRANVLWRRVVRMINRANKEAGK